MIAALKISALGVGTKAGAPKRVEGSDAQSSQPKRGNSAAGRLVLAVLFGLLLLEGKAPAQQPEQSFPVSPLTAFAPTAAPTTVLKPVVNPSEPEVLPGFPQTPDQPASLYAPPTQGFVCDTIPGPYFDCDPRIDSPVLPQRGWFVDVEVGVMLPHIVNELHDTVTVNGGTSRVQLPGGTLDWTAAPRVELGYRLPDGFGEFALAYRFLGAQGSGTASGPFSAPDALGSLLTRLDIQTADLDYASNELSICSWWMKWRIGLRGADIYFDSRVDEPIAAASGGGASGVFERRDTNNYWGIGPHGALEIERRLTQWGLLAIGRLEGSILLGRINQGFFETSTTHGGGGQFLTGQSLESNAGAVPEIEGNLGLGWRPQSCPALRVFAGYEYEHWWDIAHMPETGSVGEVYTQGVLLRADFNY
ncbi:MAG TPA: Lpg1974 family pore-forming outer membrane protein [Planctomycetaceae bacterium]|nr:Lpg1974 family pore-forming outer membrane protein [Planctomycetaceae bacterium]